VHKPQKPADISAKPQVPVAIKLSVNTPLISAHAKLTFLDAKSFICFSYYFVLRSFCSNGASDGIRTHGLLIGNQMLYQLSYTRDLKVEDGGLEPSTFCLQSRCSSN
jgi:hypothetical protein